MDALWLPGGYPELHLQALAANQPMLEALRHHFVAGTPILAECGGMLYALRSLTDLDGHRADLLGLLPGDGFMHRRTGCQGLQAVDLPEGTLRAHAHHHSRSRLELAPLASARRPQSAAPGEAVYRLRGLTASYLHFYFPSNPVAAATLFRPGQVLAA